MTNRSTANVAITPDTIDLIAPMNESTICTTASENVYLFSNSSVLSSFILFMPAV